MPVSKKSSSSSKRKSEATEKSDEDSGGRRRSKRPRRSTKPILYKEYDSDDDDSDSEASTDNQSDSTESHDEPNDAADDSDSDLSVEKSSRGGKNQCANSKEKISTGESESSEGKSSREFIIDHEILKKFKCPKCEKAFQTPNGLRYHVDNKVCLKVTPKKRKYIVKPKKAAPTDLDRTCPHCKRVFTSIDGKRYHTEKKVCLKAPIMHQDGKIVPFHTLNPGQKFVTPFGVVEVLKDDRAVPTAVFPADIKDQYRKYQKSKGSDKVREIGKYVKRAAKLRVRRNAVNVLYEKGKANRRSIFEAYFGVDPDYIRSVIKANKALASSKSMSTNDASVGSSSDVSLFRRTSNPKEPEGSFPDRIVECKWIADNRRHNLYSPSDEVKQNADQRSKKLYLQRRLLKEPYDEVDFVYHCLDCGRKFHTSQSRRSHRLEKKCIQEAEKREKKREEIQQKIEREMKIHIRFPEKRKFIKNKKPTRVLSENGKPSKWKKKVKAESGIYPELILAMGFKLVAREKNDVINAALKLPSPSHTPSLRVHRPDDILDDLKGAFQIQKRKASDQKHGSIYAGVYKALGFKHPRKRKGTDVGNNVSKRKRRKRDVKPKPPTPPKPLPPAIDVRALVDEIKSGRYPSIKVFEGEREDKCVVCRKKDGKMFGCEYCNKVEHFKCILTKFTLKEPEPDEDFMCHKCIGVILSRRKRAEKRRLRKQADEEKLIKEEAETKSDPSDGNEYPYMASQAREVNELVELLKDSQVRLRRSIETTKLNNIRRQVINGVYPDIYSKPF